VHRIQRSFCVTINLYLYIMQIMGVDIDLNVELAEFLKQPRFRCAYKCVYYVCNMHHVTCIMRVVRIAGVNTGLGGVVTEFLNHCAPP